jgi:ABC-type transport system involved in multi-copper enzyme maturation permease subunit
MFQRFYTVALNAFVETIRQPLYGVILLATAILLVLNVSLAAFTLDDDNKLLLDLGLSTLLLSGLFLSAFSAAGVLSREIDNKTVLTVISKPVSRPIFLLGKFAGLLTALLVAYYLITLVFVLTIRHGVMESSGDPWDAPVLTFGFGSLCAALFIGAVSNYFRGRDFITTTLLVLTPLLTVSVLIVGIFDEHWERIPFGSNYVGGQIIIATYLVMLIVMVTATVALAASTRFGQLMTLVICAGVLGVGIISDHAFGQHASSSFMAAVAYHVVPNAGPFWIIDGLQAGTEKTTVGLTYVAYVTGYALLLTAGILAIAVALFQRREVG